MIFQCLTDFIGKRRAVASGEVVLDIFVVGDFLKGGGDAHRLAVGRPLGRHDDRVFPQLFAHHAHGFGHGRRIIGFQPHPVPRRVNALFKEAAPYYPILLYKHIYINTFIMLGPLGTSIQGF